MNASADPPKRRLYLDTGVWIELRKAGRETAERVLSTVISQNVLRVSDVHIRDFSALQGEGPRKEIGELIGRYATDPVFREPLAIVANEILNLVRRTSSVLVGELPLDTSAHSGVNFDIRSFSQYDQKAADRVSLHSKRSLLVQAIFRAIPWVPDVGAAIGDLNHLLRLPLKDLESLLQKLRANSRPDVRIHELRAALPAERLAAIDRAVKNNVIAWAIAGIEDPSESQRLSKEIDSVYEARRIPHLWCQLASSFLQGLRINGVDQKGNDHLDAAHVSYFPEIDCFITADRRLFEVISDESYRQGLTNIGLQTKVGFIRSAVELPEALMTS